LAEGDTENALRESHEHFEHLAANITDAFWIRSPDMRQLHYVSAAFEQIWGRPVATLYANPHQWIDFTFPEDRERVLAAFATLMTDAPSIDIEYRIVRPAGEIRWIRVRGFQVRDGAGTVIRLTGIVTDITETKELESQFLRAQRMEGIGTSLRDLIDNEEGHALLTALQASTQRAADLVSQVLSFARGVEGPRTTINPLPLIRDLVAVMRDTFPQSIDVTFTPAPDLWTVTGDSTQLRQMFLNLCVNARDAMPDGGALAVGAENITLDSAQAGMHADARPGAYLRVSVTDTGSGISPAARVRMFEPFFTTKEHGKGTGLGLSTASTIVKSHDGFITVDSEVGRGSSFAVYLPATPVVSAAAHAGPQAGE
jgi:two-component system cell cycle sensor histidine kinase/response regulator CckA